MPPSMPTLHDLLTPRECEVAALIHSGFTNPEIARYLAIKIDTVKHHLIAIYDKLGCDNRVMLAVRYERENGNK